MKIVEKIRILSEDIFFRSVFCGSVAGVLKDIIDYFFYFFKLDQQPFWYAATLIAYGQPPKGLFMNIIGVLEEIIFSGFWGIPFALIARKIKTRHYLFLGIIYGGMLWFFFRSLILAFQINELKIPQTFFHPVIIWLLSVFYGTVLAWLERKLSPKTS